MTAKLVLVRIDDRLIHGQVTTAWVRAVAPDHIVVADDAVADDAVQQTLQELAATTASLGVSVCHVKEVAAVCNTQALDGQRLLVLFSSSQGALAGVESGLAVKEIDVGNLRYAEGKKQIMKAVAIDTQDAANFRRLIEQGVHVMIQMVPTDEPVAINKFLV